MIERVLQEIGLTQNEIKVYKALLELGSSKTGEILKKSGINSGKIYEILNSLEQKGLVSEILKEKVKIFSPANPKRVLDYLEEKKKEIEKQKKDYNEILPRIMEKISSTKEPSKIEVFSGIKGIKSAWQREFDYPSSETIYVLGLTSSKKYPKAIWKYFNEIHRHKRNSKGYKVKKILSEDAKKERGLHEKKAEVKFLPHGSLVSIGIIGSTTIIGIFTEDPISILIENEEVASNFKEQFNLLWKIAKR